jgi:hypothetical protein
LTLGYDTDEVDYNLLEQAQKLTQSEETLALIQS